MKEASNSRCRKLSELYWNPFSSRRCELEFYQVAGNILYLRLGAVFQLLPSSGAELVEAGRFTLLPLYLETLCREWMETNTTSSF